MLEQNKLAPQYIVVQTINKIAVIGFTFASIISISAFLFIALSRISYPYQVDWTEANIYIHVLQIIQGKPIYTAPSFEFIPLFYTPLYYYLVAPFAWVSNNIMASMRFVSIITTILSMVCLARIGTYRGFTITAKILVIGLFAACYKIVGFWYDTAHVDSAFVAFILLSYMFASNPSERHILYGILAGFSIFCAIASKQNALLVLPFIALYFLYKKQWYRLISFLSSSIFCIVLGIIILNIQSQGLFWTYVIEIPKTHPIKWDLFLRDIWILYIIPHYYWIIIAVLLSLLCVIMSEGWHQNLDRIVFNACLAIPLIGLGVASMVKQWGYINGLIPVSAAMVFIAAQAYSLLEQKQGQSWKYQISYWAVFFCLTIQFIQLRYDVTAQLPTEQMRANGDYIVQSLRESSDTAFASTAPYLLHYAGKPVHFHFTSFADLDEAVKKDPAIAAQFGHSITAINERINEGMNIAILGDVRWYDRVYNPARSYTCQYLPDEQRELTTLTGAIHTMDRICRLQGR